MIFRRSPLPTTTKGDTCPTRYFPARFAATRPNLCRSFQLGRAGTTLLAWRNSLDLTRSARLSIGADLRRRHWPVLDRSHQPGDRRYLPPSSLRERGADLRGLRDRAGRRAGMGTGGSGAERVARSLRVTGRDGGGGRRRLLALFLSRSISTSSGSRVLLGRASSRLSGLTTGLTNT
jgi:hypothetical protein